MPDPKNPKNAKPDFSDVRGGGSHKAGAPPHEGRTHTVKPGESLSKIAKEYYGDASRWPEIYEANRDKIKDPDLIHPGQEFVIPDSTAE